MKPPSDQPQPKGFSLIEVLTSMTILLIMMAGAAIMLDQTQRTWTSTVSRTTQFRDARLAFELITRNLSQSTLNTYWDYVFDDDGKPTNYKRQSELHFYTDETIAILPGDQYPGHSVFFQAVLGYSRDSEYRKLDTLLNARGYFVKFGSDDFEKPRFISSLDNQPEPRWRFRLMEYLPPTEGNMIYHADHANQEFSTSINDWFNPELIQNHTRPVVDNIIALIFSPQTSPDSRTRSDSVYKIAPNYRYDSRDETNSDTINVLPPLVRVVLVAIDEPTAVRLQDEYRDQPPVLIESGWFKRAADLDKDLEALEDSFNEDSLNYRIFTTTVAIRSAKWSH